MVTHSARDMRAAHAIFLFATALIVALARSFCTRSYGKHEVDASRSERVVKLHCRD